MDVNQVRPGMMVEYQNQPAKIIAIYAEAKEVEVVFQHSQIRRFAPCNELVDDPQLHSDCHCYY